MPSATSTPLTTNEPLNPSNFHIAIIGGGIAGLSAALSLATYTPNLTQITVYEQAPQYEEIGAGVGIGIQAARVLQKWGILDQVNAISGERNGIHRSTRRYDNDGLIVDVLAAKSVAQNGVEKNGNGHDRGNVNGNGKQEEDDGVKQLWVHRAEFLEVFYAEIKRRGCAKLETNKRAIKVEDNGPTVTIHFADNTTASAHLVIACDGIHSSIRSQFVTDHPTYSGRIAYRGVLPLSGTDLAKSWPYPSWTVSWLAPDKHFLVFPISRNRLLNVVAFVTKPESELGGLKECWKSVAPREDLEREYEGWTENVGRIIQSMGREVSSGAGHAIEDANVFGLAIRDFLLSPTPSPETLSIYTSLFEAVRLPRAQKAQITSRHAGDVYEMQGKDFEGLKTFDECVPVAAEKLRSRMEWIWTGDIDKAYKEEKEKRGLM